MTDKEMHQLAMDIAEDKVFGSWNIHSNDMELLPCIFMPMMFTEGKPIFGDLEQLAHFFEYYDKAGPRAINGYPIFFSCRAITIEQWDKMLPLIKKLDQQRKEFLGEEEG